MSKILEAILEGGQVKVGSIVIQDVVVLSEGATSSQGLLLIEADGKFYLAKTTPDLKTTIEKVSDSLEDIVSALTQVTTALTAISAVTGPAWAPPPAIATAVAQITAKGVEITASKTALDTLKGTLK